MLEGIRDNLIELIFPSRCSVCREFGPEALCGECMKKVMLLEPPWCAVCGLPGFSALCNRCAQNERYFKAARSVTLYSDVMARAVKNFKYRPSLCLEKPFGKFITHFLNSEEGRLFNKCDIALPIPIHERRLRERGFNQAEILAQFAAEALKIPLIEDCLIRTKATTAQAKLGFEARTLNVGDAFYVRNLDLIKGKNVLLVDDIMTTGSTFDSCAKCLLKAGASEVYGLALVREV